MQANPPVPVQPDPTNGRHNKKPEKTPHRAQINLNSRRKKHIPEIRIELDEMLT